MADTVGNITVSSRKKNFKSVFGQESPKGGDGGRSPRSGGCEGTRGGSKEIGSR
ncbi:hypothetical protein EYZ11_006917 [Aspergillus tanneri]|uniref:Uncharacterized protein n=1 Tax=Aspergillus tanneri TaxID=1220188 RepID=A0A4S3JEL2_9EURO|nr:hypothetical protein EYZ11_006917 [Aspergillus tanneri]